MSWKRKTAATVSMLTMAAGATLMAAQPAAAVGNCPSGYVCVYDESNFSGNKIVSASTNSCFAPWKFDFGYIRSYVNNSVDAMVWHYSSSGEWYKARTLPAGGFSSDIGIYNLGGLTGDYVCMGNGKPWNM